MALYWSFGLHSIWVRVGAGHKNEATNGVSFRIHDLNKKEGSSCRASKIELQSMSW
jgi:hypothetical protein